MNESHTKSFVTCATKANGVRLDEQVDEIRVLQQSGLWQKSRVDTQQVEAQSPKQCGGSRIVQSSTGGVSVENSHVKVNEPNPFDGR